MKRGTFKLWLVGPTGDQEQWTVIVEPIPRDKGYRVFGRVDWTERKLYLNSHIRSVKVLDRTVAHEALHITVGPNGSEWLCETHEDNWERITRRLAVHEAKG